MATAYLIYGYIGAGKTTFAKQIEQDMNGIRFTHDEWMSRLFSHDPDPANFHDYYTSVTELIYSMWPRCLELGVNVILDLNFWSRQQRDNTRRIITELGVDFKLYYLKCSHDLAWERVKIRNTNLKNNLYIDSNTFRILHSQFEPLGEDERHILIESDAIDHTNKR